ncbi:hypothetical protein ABPG72_016456 [Tetrahymena utriculariae]
MEDDITNTANLQRTMGSGKEKSGKQVKTIKYSEQELLTQIQSNNELQIIKRLKLKLDHSRQERQKTNVEINNTKNEYIAMKGQVKQFISDQNQNNHKITYPKRNPNKE